LEVIVEDSKPDDTREELKDNFLAGDEWLWLLPLESGLMPFTRTPNVAHEKKK